MNKFPWHKYWCLLSLQVKVLIDFLKFCLTSIWKLRWIDLKKSSKKTGEGAPQHPGGVRHRRGIRPVHRPRGGGGGDGCSVGVSGRSYRARWWAFFSAFFFVLLVNNFIFDLMRSADVHETLLLFSIWNLYGFINNF